MKKEIIDIRKIAQQIKANQFTYSQLPLDIFEEPILRMVGRLKMQKNLFIKEISNATDIDISELKAENASNSKSQNASILEKYRDSIKNNEVEACISLLIEIERKLYDLYNDFLFKNKPDEIRKMILGNQATEIKRDIRILDNLLEYA